MTNSVARRASRVSVKCRRCMRHLASSGWALVTQEDDLRYRKTVVRNYTSTVEQNTTLFRLVRLAFHTRIP